MGFSYLINSNWKDVTRDERYYCSELFHVIQDDTNKFIKWLKKEGIIDFTESEISEEWEIGFEVCFYRDFVFKFGDENGVKSIRESDYSQKRTFDLCLFSENRIIVIEAKSQSGFGSKQNKEFEDDKQDILKILNKNSDNFKVEVVALASSIYFENIKKRNGLADVFSGHFSWAQIHEKFNNNEVFLKADLCYNN